MIAGKATRLLADGVDQALMVEPGDVVPKAGVGIHVAISVHIIDVNAFAVGQNNRTVRVQGAQIREAVEDTRHVSLFPGID